jgi:hypothetical protein
VKYKEERDVGLDTPPWGRNRDLDEKTFPWMHNEDAMTESGRGSK